MPVTFTSNDCNCLFTSKKEAKLMYRASQIKSQHMKSNSVHTFIVIKIILLSLCQVNDMLSRKKYGLQLLQLRGSRVKSCQGGRGLLNFETFHRSPWFPLNHNQCIAYICLLIYLFSEIYIHNICTLQHILYIHRFFMLWSTEQLIFDKQNLWTVYKKM